ncbi:dihydroorotate dehydrogenase [bacterium]|nr:dihydroorotate dehydrogenase [bacterium]
MSRIDLSVNIGPMQLKNPVMVASGTFGYAEESASLIDLNKLGAIVTKAITLNPRAGNPPPRIAETPAGILNSIGLANVGLERFKSEKMPFLRKLDSRIVVNVAGSSQEEYVQVVESLEDCEGIDAYEINVSCPNVKQGGMQFGTDPGNVERLTTELRRRTARALIVKLTPNVTQIGDIARAVEQGGGDGVSLINTVRGMAIDIHTRRPKIATVVAGLSGPAIKPIAIAKVWEVYNAVPIPIIGLGGILNTDDVIEFLLAGATAIQVGTATFLDPATAEKIIDKLPIYCSNHKISKIHALTGAIEI